MVSDLAEPLVDLFGGLAPRRMLLARDRLLPSLRAHVALQRLSRRYPYRPTATETSCGSPAFVPLVLVWPLLELCPPLYCYDRLGYPQRRC